MHLPRSNDLPARPRAVYPQKIYRGGGVYCVAGAFFAFFCFDRGRLLRILPILLRYLSMCTMYATLTGCSCSPGAINACRISLVTVAGSFFSRYHFLFSSRLETINPKAISYLVLLLSFASRNQVLSCTECVSPQTLRR